MSLARYLSKLGALLGSDGKVPAAALGAGAARANFGAGAVLQVLQASATGIVNTSSTSPVDLTGLSASISVSANSKVLIIGTSGMYSGGGTWPGGRLYIYDSSGTQYAFTEHMSTVTNEAQCHQYSLHHLTGALPAGTYTFKLCCNSIVGSATQWNRDNGNGRLVLMEIAG
jgi:hypothetical protein